MTTQEIANRLVSLCRQGDFKTIYQELYSPEIVSVEMDGTAVNGFDGIQAKGKEWNEGIAEMHETWVGDPVVSGNWFSLPMSMKLTYKGQSEPTNFEEICVYQVQDQKIVKEQFFYNQ
jgi:hypothetical protein